MKNKTPAGRPESAPPAKDGESGSVRLNRYLAMNGIASRRGADKLILEGEVMVDGEIVTELGCKVVPTEQRVEVDGVVLEPRGERKRYYLLNKPVGVVCTNDPREGRRRAIDLITDKKKGRIYAVGRLDADTMGLVILTNDGDFSNRIAHPRFGVEKTYRVVVRGSIGETSLRKLREGVRLSDFRSKFKRVRLVKRTMHQSVLLVRLQEGRNREIRRVFARLGLPVKELRRVEVGHLTDRGLALGAWRPLTRTEIEGLLRLASGEDVEPGGARAPRRGGGRRRGRAATHGTRAAKIPRR